MQQSTFIQALDTIEFSIEEIHGAYYCVDAEKEEPTDRSNLKKAFESIMDIRKYFHKKNDDIFTPGEISEIIADRTSKNLSPEKVEDFINYRKHKIEQSIDHLVSKKYLITDSGVQINLNTKKYKEAVKSIRDVLNSL